MNYYHLLFVYTTREAYSQSSLHFFTPEIVNTTLTSTSIADPAYSYIPFHEELSYLLELRDAVIEQRNADIVESALGDKIALEYYISGYDSCLDQVEQGNK